MNVLRYSKIVILPLYYIFRSGTNVVSEFIIFWETPQTAVLVGS